jgi:hypothetical protein
MGAVHHRAFAREVVRMLVLRTFPCSQVIELSTPLLNVQTIMLKLGYPETHPVCKPLILQLSTRFDLLKVPAVCLKLFTGMFILLRIVYLPFVTYGLVFDAELNPGVTCDV